MNTWLTQQVQADAPAFAPDDLLLMVSVTVARLPPYSQTLSVRFGAPKGLITLAFRAVAGSTLVVLNVSRRAYCGQPPLNGQTGTEHTAPRQ